MARDRSSFWHPKSIEQLAKEQGVKPVMDASKIFGKGRSLWKSDAEFERFLATFTPRKKKAQRV